MHGTQEKSKCAQKYIETDAWFAAIFDHLFFWKLL